MSEQQVTQLCEAQLHLEIYASICRLYLPCGGKQDHVAFYLMHTFETTFETLSKLHR